MNFNWLSLIIFLPLAGAALLAVVPRITSRRIKYLAAIVTLADLALALYLFCIFDRAASGIQFEEIYSWIPAISAHYHLGVDGISLPLVMLTTLLGFIAVLISWKVERRAREFFIWLLILQSSVLGVFCSLDMLLFFIFWEIEMIPIYFLISIWGSGNQKSSALKYVLFTMAGSALMLAGIFGLYYATGSLNMIEIAGSGLVMAQTIFPAAALFFLVMAGFIVKLPVFPFHGWQPDTYTDAPLAVSVILSGAMAKMGGYGMIRLGVSIFPDTARQFAPLFLTLAVIGILYGGGIAFRQTNLKRMIAYSSMSHMGFVLLGIFALSQTSLVGASLQMVSHGLITGLLFAVSGIVIENSGRSEISKLGGLARQMPATAALFILAGLGALGLPATSGFVAEFTTLAGSFSSDAVPGIKIFVMAALPGVLLAAGYVLWTVQRVFYGPVLPRFDDIKDADKMQRFYCGLLALLMLVIGLAPSLLTSVIQNSTQTIIALVGA